MNMESQTPYSGDPRIPYIRLNEQEKAGMREKIKTEMRLAFKTISDEEVEEIMNDRIRKGLNNLAAVQFEKERKPKRAA